MAPEMRDSCEHCHGAACVGELVRRSKPQAAVRGQVVA